MTQLQAVYQTENNLSAEEFIDVLVSSTLGERRPVDDAARILKMLNNAGLIITARIDGMLVGVARSLTDFAYCTYLSDLAVRKEFQGLGIGKELIRQTKLVSEPAKLILLSAPAAVEYYPHIGMVKHDNCYLLYDIKDLK
jgi:GNAT superfamily N-acetyltransferase